LLDMLDEMHQRAGYPQAGPIWQGGADHLVPLRRFWRALRRETGLHDLRVHDLRRTWGSLAVQHGTPLMAVSQVLAHSSVAITQEHYAHLGTSPARQAVDTVAKLITDAGADSEPQQEPAQNG
jgi:integrase